VFRVSASSIPSGEIAYVAGSMSANTGAAPRRTIASTVATNVKGVVTISSPALIPWAIRARIRASVPEEQPTAWLVPAKAASASSSSAPLGPRI
jgi:hypothetical protein